MTWPCPTNNKPCIRNCRGFECRDRDDDRVTCGGGPPGDPNGEKTALLLEFARFLHTLPAEAGFDVGPARVKFDAHGAVERVLWATQEDTERWVRAFLAAPTPTDAVSVSTTSSRLSIPCTSAASTCGTVGMGASITSSAIQAP